MCYPLYMGTPNRNRNIRRALAGAVLLASSILGATGALTTYPIDGGGGVALAATPDGSGVALELQRAADWHWGAMRLKDGTIVLMGGPLDLLGTTIQD
jgi:hypothetical protein